jgi:alkanesulfonate monooxygenase SsuD/methylene tetrahydromethanopterin reductase-like flavin-dependent oxidoreductase (luciferase family)
MQFGMHLFLACARSQTPMQRYAEAIEQAVRAEALGFESVWPVEHHFTSVASVLSCPSMLLAAIAARTERLRLGTAILQLPLAHPLRIAEEIASLDVLSAGRVELGIGRGGNPGISRVSGCRWQRADSASRRAIASSAPLSPASSSHFKGSTTAHEC